MNYLETEKYDKSAGRTNLLMSSLKMAGAGATIGSSFSPLGTAIGAVAGLGLGLGLGLSKNKQNKNKINHENKLNLSLNKELANQKDVFAQKKMDILASNARHGTQIKYMKRGGSLDLVKENVVMNGPSHEFSNNISPNDKGLPIVKNGQKKVEIESLELVLNSNAVDKIESLRDKARVDPEAKKELGRVIKQELIENTYDYTKIFLK